MKRIIFLILLIASYLGVNAQANKTLLPLTGGVNGIAHVSSEIVDSFEYKISGCGAPTRNVLAYMAVKKGSGEYVDTCGKQPYWYSPSDSTWFTVSGLPYNGDSNYYVGGDRLLHTFDTLTVVGNGYLSNDTLFITGGGSGGIGQVVAGYGLLNVNDSTLKVDTSLIATQFDLTQIAFTDSSIDYAVINILNNPPVSPSNGDKYLVGTSPTGAWSGHANQIATWGGSSWSFVIATQGQLLSNQANDGIYKFNGSTWAATTIPLHQNGDNYGPNINVVAGNKKNKETQFLTNNIIRGGFQNSGSLYLNVINNGTPFTDSLLTTSNGIIKRIVGSSYIRPADTAAMLSPYLRSNIAAATYVPLTRTVNGKALSSNITLGLASSDFSNQGTTTTVLHGNAAGNPSFGQVGLTTDVTGVLPIANGGTNNGSLSVTSQNLMITDGSKIIGLAKGTDGQRLNIVGGNLTWTDTSAGGGGGSLNNLYAPLIKSGDTISTRYNILHYGADTAKRFYDFATTNTSTTVTSATASFVAGDAGKTILINGAGSAGGVLRTTISSVSNSTTIIVANAASATTSSDTTIYGKDNCPALQAAINACAQGGGGKVTAPLGTYLFSGALSGGAANAQITIPLDTGGASRVKTVVSIEGESVYGGSGSGYSLQFPGAVQTRGTILYSTISGSGTNPCFIGAGGSTRNRTDLSISNLGIMVYTNHGATAVSVTPINAENIQKTDVYRCTISPDIELTRSTSPASTEVAGLVVGAIDDNGENMITETEILGFKHDIIAGEHTRLSGNLIFGAINGLTIPGANHAISGSSQIFACVNEIYSPSFALFTMPAGNANIDLLNESEWDTVAVVVGTQWYKSVLNVSDSGGRLMGNLRINLYQNGQVNATAPHIYGVDSSKLSISTFANPYAFQNLRNVFRVPQIFYPASNDDAIRIRNSADSVSLGKVRSSSSGIFRTNDFYTNNYNSGGTVFNNANAGGYFKFATNTSTPQVYIDSAGNVGIATTSTTANQKLLINGNATISGIHYGDLTVGGAASTAHTIFVKSYDNGASVGAFRMTSGGTLQFGDFTSAGMSVAEFYCNGKWLTMTSAGVIAMPHYGAGAATFDASGNISSVSDERVKNILGYSHIGLDAIMKIRPINFKYNGLSGNETFHTYTGLSAQNVKDNIPNGTGQTSDGYLTLQDRAVMAAMINAIQEQQKEIEDLRQEIKHLKRK